MFDWFSRSKVANPLVSVNGGKDWVRECGQLDPLVAAGELSVLLQRVAHDADEATPDWITGLVAADDALANVERALRKDYLACLATQNRQHEKIWDAAYRLTSRYFEAYVALAKHAPKWVQGRTPKSLLAQMMARAIRYRELSYRYRLFRHEEWPPGTWLSVHQHFANACELQLENVTIGQEESTGVPASPITAAREYIRLLLMKLCFSGNLVPSELEELAEHIRDGAGELNLTLNPRAEHGFYVDLSQPFGLRFLNRSVSGGQFLYLDTSAVCDRFKALLSSAEARLANANDPAVKRTLSSQINIFSAAAARVDPEFKPMLRTSPRVADRSPIWATVGVVSMVAALTSTREALMQTISEGTIYGNGDEMSTFGFVRQSTIATYRPQAYASMGGGAAIHRWELRDRSDTGFRCVASSEQSATMQLGTIVAVNDDGMSEWNITTVVRIVRGSAGYTELGLRTISRTPVGVEIQPLNTTLAPNSMRMDGARPAMSVTGLVLRNAFLDTPIFPPTVILNRRDYEANAKYRIVQGDKTDLVLVTDLIEEHNDWVWVHFRVVPEAK
jgi:hypothetical protein